MSSIKLYHFPMSGESRGALLAVRAVGVPVVVQIVEDQLKAESYHRINRNWCSPTLDDNGFVVSESRAIACYLADKYGKDDQLYPKDLRRRATVDERVYFDASDLYPKIRAICLPILNFGETEIKQMLKDDLDNTFGFLEQFLNGSKWVAGDQYTIADTSIYASVSSILAAGWDISSYPNVQRWVIDCTALPGYDENELGAKEFGEAVMKNLKK